MALEDDITASYMGVISIEKKAKEIEEKIAQIYQIDPTRDIPVRPYGKPFDPTKLSDRAKYFINRNDVPLASYLNINDGSFAKVQERQEQIEAAKQRMIQKTEELRNKNIEQRFIRESRQSRGLNITTGNPNY